MGADTKGFVVTEQKNAFEVGEKVVKAIEGLMSQVNHDWRTSSIIQKAQGEPLQFSTPKVTMSTFSQMLMVTFIFNGEERQLNIHFDCDSDGEACGYLDGSKIILSLGAWGSSIEIMMAVMQALKVYGDSYLIENDCTDYELIKM